MRCINDGASFSRLILFLFLTLPTYQFLKLAEHNRNNTFLSCLSLIFLNQHLFLHATETFVTRSADFEICTGKTYH